MAASLAIGAVTLAPPTAGAASADPCPTANSSTANSCTFQGPGESAFQVPGGVTSVSVQAIGAAGWLPGAAYAAGGEGASVQGTIGLPSATTELWVEVGQVGGTGNAGNAGAGGSESDVQTCSAAVLSCTYTGDPSTDPRLIVAAGGGGGGQYISTPSTLPEGGQAGADEPEPFSGDGGMGTDSGFADGGEFGGYTTGTGASGVGGAAESHCTSQSAAGQPGTPGSGGAGGLGAVDGGSGGGGWYGGGGGGASCATDSNSSGGGGGAGLSYVPSSATGVAVGSSTAQASVTITWLQPTTTYLYCQPSSMPKVQTWTCTATVTDTNPDSPPSGAVGFSASQGSFSPSSCQLPASGTDQCSVTYTPQQLGSSTMHASYGGDSSHAASSTSEVLHVGTPPPKVKTKKATDVKAHSARLRGSVTPTSSTTMYYFQYGTSKRSLSKRTAKHNVNPNGPSSSATNVFARIRRLKPGRRYYFRLVANLPSPPTRGKILTFKTKR